MNLRDNESLINLCDPLIYLIYNRSRAGEFDALHQYFLVYFSFALVRYYCCSSNNPNTLYITGEIIPPNSNLVFEIEMLQIHDGPKPPNVFKMIDIDSDKMLTRDEVCTKIFHCNIMILKCSYLFRFCFYFVLELSGNENQ